MDGWNEQPNTPSSPDTAPAAAPEATPAPIETAPETVSSAPTDTPSTTASDQKGDTSQPTATKPTTPTKDDQDITEEDKKIENLAKVAINNGISKAIDEAKKTKDAYILDRLHDHLVDHLREELIKKNKLTEL